MTSQIRADREAAAALFAEYLAANPFPDAAETAAELTAVDYFGDSPAMANEFIALVLDGTKTATASLVADYEREGEPLPAVGDHWVACDGSGHPRAVIRTIEIRIGPIDSVDDAFAWDEGEDDRTRDSWLAGHRRFWQRTAGETFTDDSDVLFERFRVVWTTRQTT